MILNQILEETIVNIIFFSYLLIFVRRSSTTALVVINAVPEKGAISLMREGYLALMV